MQYAPNVQSIICTMPRIIVLAHKVLLPAQKEKLTQSVQEEINTSSIRLANELAKQESDRGFYHYFFFVNNCCGTSYVYCH